MCDFNPNNNGRRIDPCMRNFIAWLNRSGVKTLSSCCGHGIYPMSCIVDVSFPYEIFSGIELKNKKRFYKKDDEGVYFIPEVIRAELKNSFWACKRNPNIVKLRKYPTKFQDVTRVPVILTFKTKDGKKVKFNATKCVRRK